MVKKKRKGVKVLNPAFDPRMMSIGTPSTSTKALKRGWLIHSADADTGTPLGGLRGRINFLYNPSSITVAHTVDASLAYNNETSENFKSEYPDHLGSVVGIGNMSIPLLFDRTYELWDGSKKKTAAGRFGVYADVLAFYHFLGLTGAWSDTPNSTEQMYAGLIGETTVTQVWANLYPNKPMYPTFCYAYIGNRLKYYGQVTSLEVTYTHWNHKMIPMRCAVNISMELLVDHASAKSVKIGGIENPIPGTTPSGTGDSLIDMFPTDIP